MRHLRLSAIVLIAALGFGQSASAQSLSLSLFERYLESLRVQAGIPGLGGAILQNGSVVWEGWLGKQDLGSNVSTSPDTPYAIGGLSQVVGTTLLLRKCVEEGTLRVTDRVQQWIPTFSEPQTTILDLLTHTAPGGGVHFDLSRFAVLTGVIDRCAGVAYRGELGHELFDRLAMFDSVPSQTLASPTAGDTQLFDATTLARYASVVGKMATPYRVDRSGKATRSDVAPQPLDFSSGAVSTVRDLEKFDIALNQGVLLRQTSIDAMFASANGLTGLGWFVQTYNGQKVVWQFGMIKDAYSAMIVKLPNLNNMTLILLANSDGLSSPFSLDSGDVTSSLFARLFLKLATGQ